MFKTLILWISLMLIYTNVYAQLTETKIAAADGNAGDHFGNAVDICKDYAIIGAYNDKDNGATSGSAYIFKRDGNNWVEKAKLAPNDLINSDDIFGNSVAINNNYAVVGGYRTNAIYIYKRETESWKLLQKIDGDGFTFGNHVDIDSNFIAVSYHYYSTELNRHAGGVYIYKLDQGLWSKDTVLFVDEYNLQLGVRLSIDNNTVVAIGSHRAFVFKNSAGSWGAGQEIIPNDNVISFTGCSISNNNIFLGTSKRTSAGVNVSSASIYTYQNNQWDEISKLEPYDKSHSFTGHGSLNNNFGIILNSKNDHLESAYIIRKSETTWTVDRIVSSSDGSPYDGPGGLAVFGDYFIMGAAYDDYNGVDRGSAYIYYYPPSPPDLEPIANKRVIIDSAFAFKTQSSGKPSPTFSLNSSPVGMVIDENSGEISWTPASSQRGKNEISVQVNNSQGIDDESFSLYAIRKNKLVANEVQSHDRFGGAVSLRNDWMIVGSPGVKDNGAGSGAAYLYNKTDEFSWNESQKLWPHDGHDGDDFGGAVDIHDNYAIVASAYDDDLGEDSGSAYIFNKKDQKWSENIKLIASDGLGGDLFGSSVAINNDYAVVCASHKNAGFGAVYIFKKYKNTWRQDTRIAINGSNHSSFGSAVDIDDNNTIIVGAPQDDGMRSSTGAAYIFKNKNQKWYQDSKIFAIDGAPADGFGISVSIEGNKAIIGASYSDINGYGSGSSYIFNYENNLWINSQKLLASDGVPSQIFGRSVSISGDFLVVGARDAAYLYKYDGLKWNEDTKLLSGNDKVGKEFGGNVFIDSDNISVSSSSDDANGAASGSVYVFSDILPESAPTLNKLLPNSLFYDSVFTAIATASGKPRPTYSLIQAPSGMNIDENTGQISWLPSYSDIGTHDIGVQALNSEGQDEQSFIIIRFYWNLCE